MARTWTTPTGQRYTLYRDMLENQPHLMIAGATGSGKSVIVNALIYTALYKFPLSAESKNSVGFVLIDPQRLELVDYKDLPHTLRYASEIESMVSALQYAMELTEKRYQEMQRKHSKTYDGGQVYVIIDEFANLMTANKKRVQPLIQRLAQLGRATGVHIILATQCPTAKIIPVELKANFNARVALRTATAQDSRNIIEQSGCELLPRYGQGYYMTPEGLDLWSIPMIPQDDLDLRVAWWMNQKPRGLFSRPFRYKGKSFEQLQEEQKKRELLYQEEERQRELLRQEEEQKRELLRQEEEWRNELLRQEEEQRGKLSVSAQMDIVDTMEGHEFEHYCADLLQKLGYINVRITPGSGDQGVDVVATKDGIHFAIQCKCYSNDLGNTPVQEVNTGKTIYHCQIGVVMTNCYFTKGAKEAAEATGVLLWDRDKLQQMIEEAQNRE